jgi:hypothetical protein
LPYITEVQFERMLPFIQDIWNSLWTHLELKKDVVL